MSRQTNTPTVVLAQPALVDRFTILGVLGEGAAAAVYRVQDRERAGQVMALKVLTNKAAFDENTMRRFTSEWKVCQHLNHPNIVRAYDFFEFGNTVAFTMEYVDGVDLFRLISSHRPSYQQVDMIFSNILNGLEELHRNKILHRDLKLENVLIGKNKEVKLADLGLMKSKGVGDLTRAGVLLGTVQYMPPEYIRSNRYDHRGDLYAVGLMLFEVLARERRMADVPSAQIIEQLIKTKFAVPFEKLVNIPSKYHLILDRALAYRPDRRYQSADEMRRGFSEELAEKTVASTPFGKGVKPVLKPKSTKRSIFTFRNLLLVLLLLIMLWSFLEWQGINTSKLLRELQIYLFSFVQRS